MAMFSMMYSVQCHCFLLFFPGLFPAHSNMKPASLLTSTGSLTNASINRSPYAYEQNPDKHKCVCVCIVVCVCVLVCTRVSVCVCSCICCVV